MFNGILKTKKGKQISVSAVYARATVDIDGSILTSGECMLLVMKLLQAMEHFNEYGFRGIAFTDTHEAYGLGSSKKAIKIQVDASTQWLINVGGTFLNNRECQAFVEMLQVAANYSNLEVNHETQR